MEIEQLGELFCRAQDMVRTQKDPSSLWKRILEMTGESGNSSLVKIDVHRDSCAVTDRVRQILEIEIPPKNTSFLYFGLFERSNQWPVLYIAGGTRADVETALSEGHLDYFPKDRFVRSELLRSVAKARRVARGSRGLFDYVLQFAAAAIVAKSAIDRLGLEHPVYVGFDSGDRARIAG
jgi:hypothetical protein